MPVPQAADRPAPLPVADPLDAEHPELSSPQPTGTPGSPAMNRRSADRMVGHPAYVLAYDPFTARRRRRPDWLVTLLTRLVAGDALAAAAGTWAAARVAGSLGVDVAPGLPLVLAALWPLVLGLAGSYADRRLGTGPEEYRRVLVGAVSTLAGLAVATAALGLTGMPVPAGTTAGLHLLALAVVPLLTVLTLVLRTVARRSLHRARRDGRMSRRVVVVGREAGLADLATRLRRESEAGWQVIGACIPDPSSATVLPGLGVHVLGGLDHVPAVLDNVRADAVIVTSTSDSGADYVRRLAWQLEGTDIELLVVPGLVEVAPDRLTIRPTQSLPLVQVREPVYRGVRRVAKSVFDRTMAAVLLLLGSPLFLAIAVAVRATSPGPVLYRQRRIGTRGRAFDVLKFRSMVADADAQLGVLATQQRDAGNAVLFKMRDDPRVTPVGRHLRRFSLDELPQLVNVLRGEMSLVGPRPHLPAEMEFYGDAVQRRLLVKPGVTGLWQVSGRSDLSWEESIELDVRYVDNWSLGRDLAILWRTARAVLTSSGAY
ncbi:exopolysaccharide biosynthesis polyprenyl glycosylphosphotransferase [Modestobacter sp. I12A-02628]|uniref:Exopolysaccharide biosynthesis polyprenyl glycosylphosphotransferase n=1 Tax=Goekera deserti TaxID=2497753 RepID=A0A7K3WEW1_9ACTN|nr:sugar transferase [Goekera deserti]MPQ97937.1 exopolysaccharide biosynthesis polyprenyl glycosylphosphotransferase [Goekera deserti]NDI48583.1 exopolysaccharide biosynthesis polyprenyl glycosylphosphotransferase [Goekera deserti]NEL55038.1 exopolysaccharide biosynthesis polyprenyl glycosylphosphotransferase [Goekera deserti]